jgi:hypothetical protein
MTGKGLAAAAAAAVALLVAGSAQPRAHAPAKGLPLLGIVSNDSGQQSLVRVDPVQLRARPGPRMKITHVSGWAFSPDQRLLALARWREREDSVDGEVGVVRLFDPYAFKAVGEIAFGRGAVSEDSIAWLAPDRIVAIARDCCSGGFDLVVLDPVARVVQERRPLHFEVLAAVQARDRLAVLAAPEQGIGPVQLLLVDAQGGIAAAELDRIRGGYETISHGDDRGLKALRPALAVERGGLRAFVFAPSGLSAEVDLASLAKDYHPLALGGNAPASRAKLFLHSSRFAHDLGNGLVAVSGSSVTPYLDANGQEQLRFEPAGLDVVDTHDWTVRTIDRNADSFAFVTSRLLTRDMLLATGSRSDSGAPGSSTASGLSAYTLNGERLFHLFGSKWAGVDTIFGNRAFVDVASSTVRVVNLGSGRVEGTRSYYTIPRLIRP